MSHPILRKTAIGVGLFWLAVFLFVIVQSVLNVPIAGIKPEAVRLTLAMTFPFTAGISAVVIGVAFLIARSRPQTKRGPDLPAYPSQLSVYDSGAPPLRSAAAPVPGHVGLRRK